MSSTASQTVLVTGGGIGGIATANRLRRRLDRRRRVVLINRARLHLRRLLPAGDDRHPAPGPDHTATPSPPCPAPNDSPNNSNESNQGGSSSSPSHRCTSAPQPRTRPPCSSTPTYAPEASATASKSPSAAPNPAPMPVAGRQRLRRRTSLLAERDIHYQPLVAGEGCEPATFGL
jgi:hypothetical protein